jgi:hypothetical protein
MAGSVVRIGANTFELTKTIQVPNGGELTRTVTFTLQQARAARANLERERVRVAAQLSALEARVADADAEIAEAILQGVE